MSPLASMRLVTFPRVSHLPSSSLGSPIMRGKYKLNKYDEIFIIFSYAVSVRWEREQAEQSGQPSESSGPIMERRSPLEDFNSLFCCCARRVGSMFFLLETKDGSPIVVAGPCWPFCTFVTTPLIVIFSGMVGYFIVSNPNTKLVRCFLQLYWFLFFQITLIIF